jgi:hypothetical protein
MIFMGVIVFCHKISPIVASWIVKQESPKIALMIFVLALGFAGIICTKNL